MNKSVKKQILNIVFVVLLMVFTVYAVSKSTNELNYSNIKSFFANANLVYIGIAFICWAGFVLFEALSLHIILKKLGYKSRFKHSIGYSTADIYYSAITPSASGGQPASAYYMVKDGIDGGTSGFSLIFNLVGYTSAIIIIGVFSLIFGFKEFLELNTFVQVLVLLGIASQILLLSFFISCMCYHTLVKKVGHGIVKLLNKVRIIRKKEKWLDRVDNIVDKYRDSYEEFKKHKRTLIPVILCNLGQRVAQVFISVFVCKAATDCSMLDVFLLQAFVVLGSNTIPIPGGAVAFEYLYLNTYCLLFGEEFIVIAMMVTRFISYYFSMFVSFIYTITYHMVKKRKIERKPRRFFGGIKNGKEIGK